MTHHILPDVLRGVCHWASQLQWFQNRFKVGQFFEGKKNPSAPWEEGNPFQSARQGSCPGGVSYQVMRRRLRRMRINDGAWWKKEEGTTGWRRRKGHLQTYQNLNKHPRESKPPHYLQEGPCYLLFAQHHAITSDQPTLPLEGTPTPCQTLTGEWCSIAPCQTIVSGGGYLQLIFPPLCPGPFWSFQISLDQGAICFTITH